MTSERAERRLAEQAEVTSVDSAWQRVLELAWASFRARTTPVGAVVLAPDGSVVAEGRGRRYELDGAPGQLANTHIAHAELNALAQLSTERHWEDHSLLTSLEPCAMCHGAAIQSTVGAIVYAAPDPYAGTASVRFDTPQSRRRHLRISGPLRDARGAFATILHVAWLMELPSAAHVVAEHDSALPALTEYTRAVRDQLVESSMRETSAGARELVAGAPLEELAANRSG